MIHDLTLTGYGLPLVPLTAAHATDVAATVDDPMWEGMAVPVPGTPDAALAYVAAADADPARLAFAVVRDGRFLGSTSFYDLAPAQERVEIGHTFYARSEWGTDVNPACKRLLLGHAFEGLGLFRVALRCDVRNTRSAAAIQKLGATPEGVLRGHRIAPDGTRSDTAYFSVLRPEWPAARAGLDARLDADGGQAVGTQ